MGSVIVPNGVNYEASTRMHFINIINWIYPLKMCYVGRRSVIKEKPVWFR